MMPPSLARLIIASEWNGGIESAKAILGEFCGNWPKNKKVDCVITCGGFAEFDWPENIILSDIGDNINPNKRAVNELFKEAKKNILDLLCGGMARKLSEITRYITFGIDSLKDEISTTTNHIRRLHVELICLVDLKSGRFYWTGKSYPTNGQEKGLVRIVDLKKHFLNLEGIGKVMILGCHDLTLFNNRKMNGTGAWRAGLKSEFRALSKKEKPSLVLHHPHTTVTTRTWCHGWSGLQKILPSVKQYAGAGRYYESDRERARWGGLSRVLEATRKVETIDIVLGSGLL